MFAFFLQRKPSMHIINSPTSSSTSKLVTFGPREPCPAGTVPIPRVREEDLIRARSLLKNPSPIAGMDNDFQSHHVSFICFNRCTQAYALIIALISIQVNDLFWQLVAILVNDVETKYGVNAHLSIYNLTVVEDQFSAHRLYIENGPSDHVSAIYAGWAVSLALIALEQSSIFIVDFHED